MDAGSSATGAMSACTAPVARRPIRALRHALSSAIVACGLAGGSPAEVGVGSPATDVAVVDDGTPDASASQGDVSSVAPAQPNVAADVRTPDAAVADASPPEEAAAATVPDARSDATAVAPDAGPAHARANGPIPRWPPANAAALPAPDFCPNGLIFDPAMAT